MNKGSKKTKWRKLDDQAKIYSLSENINDTSIFRLSVVLKDKINPKILETAIEIVLEKYKAYKVKMEGGFFWYYMDNNHKKVIVTEENDYPFQKINTPENNNYLFKVTYFKNKINLELFHTLTDGNGGSMFFKEIIYKYLELCYPNKLKSKELDDNQSIEIDNSYLTNYDKKITKAYNPPSAYMLKGKELKPGVVGINHFVINLEEFKKYSKENSCSITIMLVSMLIYSIYYSNYKKHKSKKPINVCIPIDLKKYFSSNTISNFVSYMVTSLLLKRNKEYSFNEIIEQVKQEFENKLKYEKIVETMSTNGKLINSVFIKIVPLILKKIFVILGTLEFKRHFTTTLSNIGMFDVEEKYQEYIKNYYFILPPDWSEKIRCGVVSYKNNLVVTLATSLEEPSIEKKFKKLLEKNKISYEIESNEINSII